MSQMLTSDAIVDSENAAISPEIPQDLQDSPQTISEATKQFPLRLPLSVISSLENEVKARRLRGELIETPMYCRFVLENHHKVRAYDAETEPLRRENAALTQRLLEAQLQSETTENTPTESFIPNEERRAFQALQLAVKKAAETIAETSFYQPQYYETLVAEYFRQILPQIPQ